MAQGDLSWHEIKSRMRSAAYAAEGIQIASSSTSTMERRSGGVRTRGAAPAAPSGVAAPSPTPSSGTPAGATAPSADAMPSASSTPAPSTPPMSSADTVWSQSPAGYLEQSWIANTLPLSGLPAAIAERLQVVATGRGEPIEQIVHEIAEFLVTAEDERGEGRLDDAVVFYVENYLLPT